jgi:hypothetical protein
MWAGRCLHVLEQFWVSHDPAEGVRRFAPLLERADELPPELRAAALRCYGGACSISGNPEHEQRLHEESLALYERLGDERGIVALRHRLAVSVFLGGDVASARSLVEENLSRAVRRSGSRRRWTIGSSRSLFWRCRPWPPGSEETWNARAGSGARSRPREPAATSAGNRTRSPGSASRWSRTPGPGLDAGLEAGRRLSLDEAAEYALGSLN